MFIPKTHCPGCRIPFTSDPGFPVGRTIRCPKCGTSFTVTAPAPTSAPKPAPAPAPAPRPVPARTVPATTPPPARPVSLPPKPTPVPKPPRAAPKPPPLTARKRKPARLAPRPAPDADTRSAPGRLLLPVVLIGVVIAAAGAGYFVIQTKLRERAEAAARTAAPAVAPEPVGPAALAPAPPRKEDAPGTAGPAPGKKPVDDGTPAVPPMPAPPVAPELALAPAPRPAPEPAPELALAPPPRPAPGAVPAPVGAIPRRMLFVHVSKYLYLNPLTAPAGGADRTRAAAQALADRWDVPTAADNNQLFVLSDTLPAPDGRHLVKDVLETTFQRFFETSRGQDRVVVYFGGHVLERDGKVYLAPVEANPDEVGTLVSLDAVYAGLGACPAAQKVVIWDVCRYNPQRGRSRPGSESMTETLYAALTAAPPGVEVIVACRPGENALEFFTAPPGAKGAAYSGSLFLEALRSAPKARPAGAKGPAPTDPISIAELAPDLTLRVAELAKLAPGGAAQTVGIAGRPRDDPARYDPAEPVAVRFELPNMTGAAPPDDISALIREFAVPPIRTDAREADLVDAPYRADALKEYAPDVTIEEILKDREKYPFRVAVIEALDEVRSRWKAPGAAGGLRMRTAIPVPVTEALKTQLKAEQDAWAIGVAKLELLSVRLDDLVKDRAAQPPRWQAHYDYARAVLKSRLAYMQEYNLAVGNVLTATLPEVDPKLGHDAYTLTPIETAKMKSKKAVKQLAADAEELFEKLAVERKGTPWAVQARRDRAVPLGLSWLPTATKGPPAP